uniref:Candidate secreted effector n=1 Tax=Meloidogyne incognita TaxID=6306 RepID=A0A914LPI2_MELIC
MKITKDLKKTWFLQMDILVDDSNSEQHSKEKYKMNNKWRMIGRWKNFVLLLISK